MWDLRVIDCLGWFSYVVGDGTSSDIGRLTDVPDMTYSGLLDRSWAAVGIATAPAALYVGGCWTLAI